jgi:hypothetical protein
VDCEADLEMTALGPEEAFANAEIHYQFRVSNTGPSTADYEIVFRRSPGNGTTCDGGRGPQTGTLQPGASEVYSVTITCALEAGTPLGQVVVVADVAPSSARENPDDPDVGNNGANVVTAIKPATNPANALHVTWSGAPVLAPPENEAFNISVSIENPSVGNPPERGPATGVQLGSFVVDTTPVLGATSPMSCSGVPASLAYGDIALGATVQRSFSITCDVDNNDGNGTGSVCIDARVTATDGSYAEPRTCYFFRRV